MAHSRRMSVLSDMLMGALAVGVVALWTWLEVGSLLPQPALEDAAMLFRYAENLAAGGGLTWNFGEDPGATDGATDLGFVLVLAPLVMLGIPVTYAAWILNLTAIFGLGFLISRVFRRNFELPQVFTFLFVVLIMSTFVNRFVTSGFSPPIFAFLLTLVFMSGLFVSSSLNDSTRNWILLGILAGSVGWWRPEGFALGPMIAVFAVLTSINWNDLNRSELPKRLSYLIVGILVPVVAWTIFRIVYFGHLLPSSGVMKSGSINRVNLLETMQYLSLTLLPVIAVVIVVSIAKPNRIGVLLLALIAFSAIWMPITLQLNWWNRMQWPLIIPLGLIAVATVAVNSRSYREVGGALLLTQVNTFAVLILALVAIATLRTFSVSEPPYTSYQPHTAISLALQSVDTTDVRLATSEAGLVPLAISGPAIDTYGFNNYAIASTGGEALIEQLDLLQPNVVVVNGRGPTEVAASFQDPTCNGRDLTSYSGSQWVGMTDTLLQYAQDNALKLIRSTETGSCNAFSIFVSSEVTPEVVAALQASVMDSLELVQ